MICKKLHLRQAHQTSSYCISDSRGSHLSALNNLWRSFLSGPGRRKRKGVGRSHEKHGRKGPIWYTAHVSTALKNEIKKFAQESVRKVLTVEMMRLRASLLATVSKKEQRNIDTLYKKPSGKAVRSVRVRI